MLLGIKKEYESGKAIRIYVEKRGFLGSKFYEVSIFTTKPKVKLPDAKAIKQIAALIPNADWKKKSYQGFTHETVIDSFPDLQIRLKEIDKPELKKDDEAAN